MHGTHMSGGSAAFDLVEAPCFSYGEDVQQSFPVAARESLL